MLEEFKESTDPGDEFGASFTDLSKEFNCIDHNLLITKLSWFGITTESFNLIFSHLRKKKQSVRINNSCSNKREIMYGVPQGSVLGHLLSSLSEKLLGISFDSELKFEEHISKICNIVNKKFNALHSSYVNQYLEQNGVIQ